MGKKFKLFGIILLAASALVTAVKGIFRFVEYIVKAKAVTA